MLPACACPSSGNRTCALCVYTIVDHSGDTMETCKCPTCRVQWTAMRVPSCGGVQGDLVQLQHASLVQQPVIVNAAPAVAVPVSGNVPSSVALPMALPMPVQPATVLIDDDGGMDDVLAELDEQRAEADDPPYVPPGRRMADDSDEEFESDDDSVVGDDAAVVDTRLDAASSPSVRRRVGGPKKSIMKKSSGARKNEIIRINQPTVQAAVSTAVSTNVAAAPVPASNKRPSNGKPVSRCMGSEPRKVPSLDDWSKKKINGLLTKFPDMGDDDEMDSDAIAADCKVLMMKALYFHGKNCDGAAAKYPRAIKELMDGPRGFARRGEMTEAAASRARSIATKLATAAQATNKQSVERLTNNYMDAYAMYMKVRKLAADGGLDYSCV
jgi:hypothetical protein